MDGFRHSRSLSESKIYQKSSKKIVIKNYGKACVPAGVGLVVKRPTYCLSKFYSNISPMEGVLSKKLRVGCKGKGKEQEIQSLPGSTQPSDERCKILFSIEAGLKNSESFCVDEKVKVAFNALNQLANFNGEISQVVLGIRGIFEQFSASCRNHKEEVKNIKSELNEYKQTLKILTKRFKKLAFENLSLTEKASIIENRYLNLKESQKSLKKEIEEKNNLIENFENKKERVIEDMKLFKRLRKKLTSVQDFDDIEELVNHIEGNDKVHDKFLNFSSIDLNSERFIKDSPNHKKSQSSSIVYF